MINNLREAEMHFEDLLNKRNLDVCKKEQRIKPGNTRYYTTSNEIYHIKYTKKPFKPDPDKHGPARELHLKLHYAINAFQYRASNTLLESEIGTMVGIDEDLSIYLTSSSKAGYMSYIVTILERGVTLWISSLDFYNFTMRHDTFIKYPRSGIPVCYVPTGYFLNWSDPLTALPKIVV